MLLKFFVFMGAFSFFVATASDLPDPKEKIKLSLDRLNNEDAVMILAASPHSKIRDRVERDLKAYAEDDPYSYCIRNSNENKWNKMPGRCTDIGS